MYFHKVSKCSVDKLRLLSEQTRVIDVVEQVAGLGEEYTRSEK
jgi:hypothetical protein